MRTMQLMTRDEYVRLLRAQGVAQEDLAVRCPMCGTIQSARDLIAAGAGADFEAVERYLAFSCVGRWRDNRPPPQKITPGYQGGCNWTLGGLFRLHQLEVVTPDGVRHPRFAPATPDEAQQHAAESTRCA